MANNYQGIGFYHVRYSDGGQPYTNDGAIWIDSEDDFNNLMSDAASTQGEYHVPYSEYLGDPQDLVASVLASVHALENCMCEASYSYGDFGIERSDLHEILDSLLVSVGRSNTEELAGPIFDALHLAEMCADLPYYSVLADLPEVAERVFCQVNFIESVDEYNANTNS